METHPSRGRVSWCSSEAAQGIKMRSTKPHLEKTDGGEEKKDTLWCQATQVLNCVLFLAQHEYPKIILNKYPKYHNNYPKYPNVFNVLSSH